MNSMKAAAILVHGIGAARVDWAEKLTAGLERQVELALSELPGGPYPRRARDVVVIESVLWEDVVAAGQRQLFDRLKASRPQLELKGSWWERAKELVTHAARSVERTFVTDYIADIIDYLDERTKKQIHAKLRAAVGRAARQVDRGQRKSPLTIVSHSLGTVVSSDYAWDRIKPRKGKPTPFHSRFTFMNFFTLGSPLALFSLQHGGPEAFSNPVRVEHPDGRWVNIRDKDDPVGMPLKTLNAEYRAAVHHDVEVDSGDYLLAHMGYFSHEPVLRAIGRKLALDWVASNGTLSAKDVRAQYQAYDRDLSG
jgi:hypothetical protein